MKYPEEKLSYLLNNSIYDNSGQKIGKLIDAVFTMHEHSLELSKLIVGGSAIEEFLEKIKVKKDIDPVFKMSSIAKFDEFRINLNKSVDELKSTHLHEDAIDGDEIKFSHLKKFKVHDHEGTKIGNLIDLRFQENEVEFILGDGFFTELLEDMGLKQDIDFIVTNEFIENISDGVIKLSNKKEDLQKIITEYRNDHSIHEAIYLHHPYMM